MLAGPEGQTVPTGPRWKAGSRPMAGRISRRASMPRATAEGVAEEGTAAPTWPDGLVSRTALPAG